MRTRAIGVMSLMLMVSAGSSAAKWESRANIPYHVYGHMAAALGDRVHLMGGCHGADWTRSDRQHQVYDVATNRWSNAAPLPEPLAWSMPTIHQGRIYLFGGMQPGATTTRNSYVYNPSTNQWSSIAPLPVPIMNGFAATVGNFIYVGLGYERVDRGATGVRTTYRNTYRYCPATNTYTRMADAPEGGCYITYGTHDGQIHIVHGATHEIGFHGMNEYGWTDGFLRYNPGNNTWTRVDSKRVLPRIFNLTQTSASVTHADRMYIIGGHLRNRRTTVSEYLDMSTGTFHRIADIPHGRCCGGGAVTENGMIVVAGGFWGTGETDNPAIETWVSDGKAAGAAASTPPTLPSVPEPPPSESNIALNNPATADSHYPGYGPSNANDANGSTYWAPNAAGAGGRWWQVDLQAEYELYDIYIRWEFPQGTYRYHIQTSSNGSAWHTAIDMTNNRQAGNIFEHDLSGKSGRYVRIAATGALDTNNWIGIYDVRIYGGKKDRAAPPAGPPCSR